MEETKDVQRIDELLSRLSQEHNIRTDMTLEEVAQEQVKFYNDSIGNLNEKDGYNCNLCKNKGYVAEVKNKTETHFPCKCQNVRETLRRARMSGLGNILKDFTFDKYIVEEEWQQKLKDLAQAFCKDDNAKWFFLGGQSGCGKTHLCSAICAYYIKAGLSVAYMSWEDDAKQLKALITDHWNYQEKIQRFKKAEVLYIDDLFKTQQDEAPTRADINLAFEIINHRLMNENKITIISSEKTIIEMLDYDEGTVGRVVKEAGDYRKDIARDRKKNYRLRGLIK